MPLVDYGIQVVKEFCFRSFLSNIDNARKVPGALICINNVLDIALSTINQIYFDRTLDDERNAQLLRLRMVLADLSIEVEHVKSELLI